MKKAPTTPLVASSIDSTVSALRLVADNEDESQIADRSATYKFAVSVSFKEFKNVGAFCRNYHEKEGTTGKQTKFSFSWLLFGRTFQSDVFDGVKQQQPKGVKDTIRVRCPTKEAMMAALGAADAMNITLHAHGGKALASVTVPVYRSSGASSSSSSKSGSSSSSSSSSSSNNASGNSNGTKSSSDRGAFADQSTWHVLQVPGGSPRSDAATAPSVNVTTSVSIEEEPQIRAMPQISENDGYGDDSFEDDDPASPVRQRGVRFSGTDEREISAASSSVLDVSHGETSGEEDDIDVDDCNRYYSVKFDVRSIGGLSRAANVAVSFAYPSLSTTRTVQTQPMWLPATSEARLDGAAVTFDCVLSRNRLRDIFSDQPLKITATAQTHMGTSTIGDAVVDLFSVLESPPHSFRCPTTTDLFKTAEEYASHRVRLMEHTGTQGGLPKEPTTIWAQDMEYPLTSEVSVDDSRSDGGVGAEEGSVEGHVEGRVRVVVIIEEMGVARADTTAPVKVAYKMHKGALYALQPAAPAKEESMAPPQPAGNDPLARADLSSNQRLHLEKLRADWETFRLKSEAAWRASMYDKEKEMRSRLEADANKRVAERAEDLRRAQEEAGRLEVRLRGALEEADKMKNKMAARDDQVQMKLAQKTAELQLLQRRVRDEAKARIDAEVQRAEGLSAQLTLQKSLVGRLEQRVRDSEHEFESFRAHARGTPESVLREDVARLRAQVGECRAEMERERRIRSDAELEKEHFRAQMHRLALALKRERERSAVAARQDLEQLRLEFLSREERFVLDGDRDELRNIRHELANLRIASVPPQPPTYSSHNSGFAGGGGSGASSGVGMTKTGGTDPHQTATFLRRQLEETLATGLYPDTRDGQDIVVTALRAELAEAEAVAADVLASLR